MSPNRYWICVMGILFSIPVFGKMYTFPINSPRNLNFSADDEIFRIRKKMLSHYPIFFSGEYHPKKGSVFRQVVEKKPWWGLRGLMCYGPGQLAIEGESDESRFIDNPFLLVSVEEGHALVLLEKRGNCPLSYPKPTKLTFDSDKRVFFVSYNISSHEKTINRIAQNNHIKTPQMTYSFGGRNAIDFGIPYVYASDVKNLKFVSENNITKKVYHFKDFIHVGGSCGYVGGCNNGSPDQPEVRFKIERYPASIKLKLWKKAPSSVEVPADLLYEIKIN